MEYSDSLRIPYWHLWTDADGVSHQQRCTLSRFESQSMGGRAAPQWNDQLLSGESNLLFSILPAGWTGDWHENPKPQWIAVLAGSWFVESMDGTRVEMRPGDLAFGGDQNAKPDAQGRVGHRSGTVGNEPCALMIIQLDPTIWTGLKPGDFK